MTAQELINKLRALDPDTPVCVRTDVQRVFWEADIATTGATHLAEGTKAYAAGGRTIIAVIG